MQANTDPEIASVAASSPERQRSPAYYVQSPSHDGEKTTASLNSTPIITSPVGSPRHSSSGGGGHSRESSTGRYSGPIKPGPEPEPGPRKAPPYDAASVGRGRREEGFVDWGFELDLMEEGLFEKEKRQSSLPLPCKVLAFLVGFFVVFSLFCLVLWGASIPQKPKITMQSIKFERFMVQAGIDNSGVSTDMISLNSTLKFTYKNTATFFGVHVSSTPIYLSYSQLQIGLGSVQEFYKKRKQEEKVAVVIAGDKIPMYGSGTGMTDSPVPLTLEFTVRSRGHVLGKLVKQIFYNKIECYLIFTMIKIDVPISLRNCT